MVTGLEHAIVGLQQALNSPRRHDMWRWLVRHRMAAVKEVLTRDLVRDGDASLAARELTLSRERESLLRRLSTLGPQVLEASDVEPVRLSLLRLLSDLDRHRRHLNDLVYDSVSLELGGSE